MGAASTKEHCRECGKVTLYKQIAKAPGFIIWRVVCEECQDAIRRVE